MKQNILIFSPREVNATKGGIERVSETLAKNLMLNGYNVVFLSVERTGSQDYHCVAPQYFIRDHDNVQWILEIVRKHDIRLIINQMSLFNYCPKSSLPAYIKVITVMHDSYYAMYERLELNIFRRWNWKRVIKDSLCSTYEQSDRIVVFFKPFIDEYRFFCPYIKEEKFVVIPNFNSFENPKPSPKERKLLWVGRHAEWHKRPTDMLKVWSILENQFPDWSIDIVGDGPDGGRVRELQKSLKLVRCTIHGCIEPESFYKVASIVCMTSAFESFGMILTEGMQFGCVPFAYDSCTAIRNLIHDNHNGILVTPFDVDEYARKLAAVMSDEETWAKFSEVTDHFVEKYDSKNVFPQWLKLIDSL